MEYHIICFTFTVSIHRQGDHRVSDDRKCRQKIARTEAVVGQSTVFDAVVQLVEKNATINASTAASLPLNHNLGNSEAE